MSHPQFLGLGLFYKFYQKSGRKIVFDRFFDASMLDMNGLRRNHCVSTDGIHIFTKLLNR